MRAEQRGSLSDLNMNLSVGEHVHLRTTSLLTCALFNSSTQQISDKGKWWGGGLKECVSMKEPSLPYVVMVDHADFPHLTSQMHLRPLGHK